MRYILAFIKMIILGMLIFISIYQTGKLWFEDTSDRNFFYDRTKTVGTVDDGLSTEENFIVPMQLGVFINSSDIEYSVVNFGDNSYDNILSSSLDILGKCLEKGTKVLSSTDINELWKKQHVVLVLPFAYTGNDLTEGFSLQESKIVDVETVNAVYIIPADDEQSSVHVYLEGDDDKFHQYQINTDQVIISNEVLNYYLKTGLPEQELDGYVSTRMYPMLHFDRTLLLPLVSGDIRYHRNLFWEIPFVSDDVIDEEGIRYLARPFFNNPDVLSSIIINDEIRLSAENMTVRYNTKGVFEYVLVEKSDEATMLPDAVALSKQFLGLLDRNAAIEYCLEDYEIINDGIKVYYNLAYNGFPVPMSKAAIKVFEMDYAVEVTVRGNRVVHFKSLIRSIPDRLPQFEVFNMPYIDALDQLLADTDLTSNIDSMYLGYLWEEPGTGMVLHWIINVDDDSYFIEVEEQ